MTKGVLVNGNSTIHPKSADLDDLVYVSGFELQYNYVW